MINHFGDCPDPELLIAFGDGEYRRIPEGELGRCALHSRDCEACRTFLAGIGAIVAAGVGAGSDLEMDRLFLQLQRDLSGEPAIEGEHADVVEPVSTSIRIPDSPSRGESGGTWSGPRTEPAKAKRVAAIRAMPASPRVRTASARDRALAMGESGRNRGGDHPRLARPLRVAHRKRGCRARRVSSHPEHQPRPAREEFPGIPGPSIDVRPSGVGAIDR